MASWVIKISIGIRTTVLKSFKKETKTQKLRLFSLLNQFLLKPQTVFQMSTIMPPGATLHRFVKSFLKRIERFSKLLMFQNKNISQQDPYSD